MLRLSHQLRDDPRVVRWGTLSLGSSLDRTSLTAAPRRTVTEHDPIRAALSNVGPEGDARSVLDNLGPSLANLSPQARASIETLDRKAREDETLAFARDSQYMYSTPPKRL